ncbi:MAG TPA: FHA domain-containing protein, partial [Kofleriaceae bacterium]|nr:FHA domain-containing protein [Kofleriaceae bacterium]
MSDDEHIRIQTHELFDPQVDKALQQQRQGRERIVADPPPVSAIKRLLLNSLIYLPLAAFVGSLACWLFLEPKIEDMPVVGGEVQLINADPFDTGPGMHSLTIGSNEVYVDPNAVEFEPGTDGQQPFTSFDQIQVGTKIEVAGLPEGSRLVAAAIRPTDDATPRGSADKPAWPLLIMFPLTAALIAFGLLLAEGLTTRNWVRMIERTLLGSFMAALFATLAFIPAIILMGIAQSSLNSDHAEAGKLVVTIKDVTPWTFIVYAACRSGAWACIGAATGLGMNIVRSTRTQLRNSVIGGALGGAFGGLFFDPIDRWVRASAFNGAEMSRMVGLIMVGLAIGIFVALVERLGRDAWLRVRTGPLAGKSFILYKTPTTIGSDPACDVYLYKDAELAPRHASLHRVG